MTFAEGEYCEQLSALSPSSAQKSVPGKGSRLGREASSNPIFTLNVQGRRSRMHFTLYTAG